MEELKRLIAEMKAKLAEIEAHIHGGGTVHPQSGDNGPEPPKPPKPISG